MLDTDCNNQVYTICTRLIFPALTVTALLSFKPDPAYITAKVGTGTFS